MEKTIKYLENGEYHYATVKDVGDLAKLKTDSKDDLVTAINELFTTGGEASKKPDGYNELVDNVADAIQKQQQMTDTITNMQQSAQLSDAEMQHMKQVQEELHQEYLKAIKELNEAVDKAKADAADLDKKTSDLQDKLDETFASVDKEVSDVHKQLDSESAGLRKDLDDTKTSLESTRKDLLNNTQEFGVVNSEVKELKDKMDRRIWSTDLDPVREQVNKNTTEVAQTKDELKSKADQSNLDLVTNSVENLSTQVKENADGLKVSVKKDELGGDVAKLLNDKTNLLLGTRSFSGEDNWKNRDAVTIEPGYYKGLKSIAVQVTDRSIYQPYHVKANTAYTFSFFGKEDKDNPKAILIIKPIDAPNINIDNAEQPVHITTEWQRFAVTFSVDQECEISIQIIQGPEANNNILHLAGFKLQYGQNNTPWEPNEADVAENIEHNESQFNVYSDQIAGIVKKQEKMGDTERQLDTRITETAEGLKQTSKDLQDANGKITEFKGQLESTARGLKTEYEKYTNDAIGQISDSSLNLIRNSAFQNKDENFAQWQNVSAKANIREDGNGLRWVELTQSGMTTDNPQGITSNYFVIKQGKVTVAVDIKLGDKANLDNQNILLLELYNDNKQRVDFTDVSVSQLGLSTAILNDHNVHRGLYRLGIDREDAKYMTVKAILHRNGDLWFTNFSARLSSIDDGGYTPNPDDLSQQILKMNTKIEEDAEHIALKANSVDVTRDIKSAVQNSNGGGVNLLPNSKDLHTGWTADGTSIFPVDDYLGVRAVGGLQRLLIYPTEDTKGKLLSVSFDACVPSDSKEQDVQIWVGPFQAAIGIVVSGSDFKRYKAENWKWNSVNGALSIQLKNVNDKINIKNIKLEYGPVATPWTPAPEDTSEEIKSAKDAAIKVASDQIDLHVNELRTSFDDKLNKQINEAKSASQKFTSDGIEQTVKKITDVKSNVDELGNRVDGVDNKVNNLQVGGRNYISPSQIAGNSAGTPQYDSNSQVWTVNVGNGVGGSWGGGIQFAQSSMSVPWGKAYTDSVEVYVTDSNLKWQIDINNYGVKSDPNLAGNDNDDRGRAVIIPSTNDSLPTNQWVKLSVTVWNTNPKNTNHTDLWDGSSFGIINQTGHTVTVKFRRPKQELGSKATDWSPNPDDTTKEIKSAQDAAIKIASDKIDMHVNELRTSFDDKLNKQINESKSASQKFTSDSIEQTVRKITDVKNSVDRLGDKVDNIQVGGRNLLRNSDKDISVTSHTTDGYPAWANIDTGYSFEHGKTYTFSTEARNSTDKITEASIRVFESSTNTQVGIYALHADGKRHSVTFTVPNDSHDYHLLLYAGHAGIVPGVNVTTTYHHPKLEEGNVATDWTPAPEDVDSKFQYKEVTGVIDFNDLKTQQKIFYKDTQAKNSPAGGTYWYFVDVDVEPGSARIIQTATSDRNNITWKRTFADTWTAWQKQASQGDVDTASDGLRQEIKSAKEAAIKVSSDQINLHVNEITSLFDDRLNKRVNEVKTASEKFTSDGIEQTVRKITDVKNQVDGIRVGARNLLHGTSDKYRTLTGDGYLCQTTATDFYTSTANYHAGDWFTYAATITNNSTKNVTLETWLFDGNKASLTNDSAAPYPVATHSEVVQPGQGDKRVSTSFRISGTTWYIRTYVIFDGGGAPANSKVQVKDERLVEGNMAGTWSPNPDDVDKKTDTQTLDSANIDQMKTQGHYFVHNLTGNPIGGWVYVDVIGVDGRIRQDVYQDSGSKHMYRRLFGTSWSGWEQGAYLSDVNSLKTEVTASVKNLGDRVTTEVNSITTKVNSNNGGGINLLRGTGSEWKTLTGSVWFCQTTGAGAVELGSFTTGDTVTYSITVRNNSQYAVRPEIVGFSDDNGTRSFNISGTESVQPGETKTVSVSATVAENTVKIIGWLISSGSEPTFSVDAKNEKLERGSVATPWSPAPEDTAEAIKTLNTKWDVANGQIQGKVTATDVNNILNGKGYATQSWAQTMFTMKSDAITLQAVRDNITNGIQNQVNDQGTQISNANTKIADTNTRLDNLRVGGTNLLKGTSNIPRTLRGGGWLAKSTANDVLTSVDGYHAGDQFTYSATITNNSSRPVSLEMWLFKDRTTSINQNSHSMQIPAHAQDQRVSATITITEDTKWVRNYIIYSDGQGQDSESIVVSNEKFEFGNVATSWTPNPNDGGSGVNLLRGTADFSWPDGIGENGTVNKSYEKFDDMTVALHISGNNSGIYTKWGRAFPDGQIQVGEQYTFSFDIKGTGTFSMVKNESESVNIASGIPVTSDYQRVKVTGTVKALDQAFVIYFQGAYDVHIKNVKIERGTIATPWTPHPFDEKNKGINLLKSTAYWNPNDWNHISDNVWYDDNWVDSNGHKAYGHHTAWQGLGQTVYVTPGVYTWSAQIYLNGLDSNDFVYPYMGDSQYNGTVQVQDIRKPMLGVNDQNKWINYSTTFYVKNAGNLCVRPELNRDHGTIHVGSQKLEHGMVATPWSPSPLDDKTATITLDSADINSMKTQGHYFVKNLANSPIAGWVYVDVTGNGNDRIKQDVYQDNGYEHKSRRWYGSYWTEWTTDVNNKNVVSQINITPDQIKIASNKIVIDGNTDIHGVLSVPEVKLQGKSGMIGLDGNSGIIISSADTLFQTRVTRYGMDFLTTTNGRKEIMGGITTGANAHNVNLNGISVVLDTGQKLGDPYGGDFFSIGSTTSIKNNDDRTWTTAMDYDASGAIHGGGFMWYDKSYVVGEAQNIYVGGPRGSQYAANDPLFLGTIQFNKSAQPDIRQPAITLGYANTSTCSNAGLGILWNQMKPYGNWDITDVSDIWYDGQHFRFTWVSHPEMMSNASCPAFIRLDGNGAIASGICFAWGSVWAMGAARGGNIVKLLL